MCERLAVMVPIHRLLCGCVNTKMESLIVKARDILEPNAPKEGS